MTGVIGWARDEDVYCVPAGLDCAIRWRARDVGRDAGAVLEVTPMRGTEEGAPVRVHTGGKGHESASDTMSPWSSMPVPAEEDTTRCLRVRLVYDPWTSE